MNSSWRKLEEVLPIFLSHTLGLKKRITFGYILTGTVAFIIALLAWGTFDRFAADLRQIIFFSRNASDNITFAAHMAEMQREALIYIHEGHRSASERVGVVYKEMIASIGEKGLPETEPILVQARTHLTAYYKAFQKLERQRDIQERLVKIELRVHAIRAQQLIEELTRQTPVANRLECARLLNSFLQIEKNAYRYFDSFDEKPLQATSVRLKETRSILKKFSSWSKFKEIQAVMDEYESAFLEAVQRTRGYLYLVNVVMAAESYETMYQAQKLSNLMLHESEQVQEKVTAHISSRLWILLFSCALLLLCITFFSCIVTRSITLPLKRLTQTFQSLAAGSLEAEIPFYPLEDELGALTRAARSFKERNLALERSKAELERSNDELEQFVYTVSHDLKSPIVTSMGFIAIIRKLADRGNTEQALGMLDKVVAANERMSQLINDLLELSRVGRIDMDSKLLDLDLLLTQFAHNQTERLAQEQFSLIIEPGLPTIFANESRVLQVFENILSNALKYANAEKNGSLSISSYSDAQWHHILCADTGTGIPEEFQEKIFTLFYRLDVTIEGTGIGLAVTKKIMKFHGGEIWAEAGPEGGTTFHLTFPKIDAQAANQT